jgi:uncharacterized protein (DUF885 family)
VHQQLAYLSQHFWDTVLEASPTVATMLGDHRWDDRVEDLSRQEEDRLIDLLDGFAAEAEAIDPGELNRADRITRRSLVFEASSQADRLRNRSLEFGVDPMLGIHMQLVTYIPQLTPQTAEQADALVAKASRSARMFDQAIERLRQGIDHGRTPPRILVEKSIAQMDAYLQSPTSADGFLRIAPPSDMDTAAVAAWRARMAAQVTSVVRPALARYRDVVAAEVAPAARPQDEAGLCWLPDGEEIYARSIRAFTSLDLDPIETHRLGLSEITALEDEYRTLAGPVLRTTDIAEVYDRLRNDPDLRFHTAAEVKAAGQAALERANAAAPEWFGRLPATPCILQEVPEVGAADAPIAFYLPPATDGSRPGIFFINTTEPTTRTRFESEALAFHESVPGHHFQIAIAQELEGIPAFRRNAIATAYVEGWGLYVERLADEMGLYTSEIARMGMLSFDSWRAGRLVVDTGLHALGWSRRRAIDYLTENSPQAPNNIVNEVDRYIGYFGQALAYKTGQRELFRLRRDAERRLGSRFDIRGFHDAVLGDGAVPLDLLADLVDEWISAATGGRDGSVS